LRKVYLKGLTGILMGRIGLGGLVEVVLLRIVKDKLMKNMRIITGDSDCQNALSLIERGHFRCREVVCGVGESVSFFWDGFMLVDVGDGGFDILNRYRYGK
jgi:hypothetical protein